MKRNVVCRKIMVVILLCVCLIPMLQPIRVKAASTTEKKATVKFSKTKATGFKKISDLYTRGNYLIAFGEKESGNVLSYSSDGITFRDIDLDKAIKKEYSSINVSSIHFNSHIRYVDKRGAYCFLGSFVSKDNTTYHFLTSISSNMKKVSILKLDGAIEKIDQDVNSIEVESYFDYDYKSGTILVNGSYMDSMGEKIPMYLLIKKNSDISVYKNPNQYCDNVEFVGNYLVCYNWQLSLTNDWSQSSIGYFYYSKDFKTWSKAKTPNIKTADGWNRSYYDWESFCASPQDYSSDTFFIYYTNNMKDYKSISKKFVVKSQNRHMELDRIDNKIIAIERGYGDKTQLVLSEKSTKSGSKWRQLFEYTAKKEKDFRYIHNFWIDDGFILINDGTTKKLFKYGSGKEYDTKLEVAKLDLYGEDNGFSYGTYDKKYILATKNGLITNYLFQTPVKIKGLTMWEGKKAGERFYVYSDNSIYYVNKSTLTKTMK